MLQDTRFSTLEAFAARARRRSKAAAKGLCLHATLVLAREAARLGLAERVAFVRWRVRDDADFLEHWALSLEDGRVLDMTAVQVDGRARYLRTPADYPANFVRPRRYPLALVLAALPAADPAGGRYSRRTLWSLHRRLFRHDAGAALRGGSAPGLLAAAKALGHAAVTLAMGHALERATARVALLRRRLG